MMHKFKYLLTVCVCSVMAFSTTDAYGNLDDLENNDVPHQPHPTQQGVTPVLSESYDPQTGIYTCVFPNGITSTTTKEWKDVMNAHTISTENQD